MYSASTACAPGPFGWPSFGANLQLVRCSGRTLNLSCWSRPSKAGFGRHLVAQKPKCNAEQSRCSVVRLSINMKPYTLSVTCLHIHRRTGLLSFLLIDKCSQLKNDSTKALMYQTSGALCLPCVLCCLYTDIASEQQTLMDRRPCLSTMSFSSSRVTAVYHPLP